MLSNVFAGLDWAVHTHAVCVIDATGAVLERFEIAHDREGLAELLRRLARFGPRVRIAIERPSGLIVDALVEAGHQVFPIHPNAVKASRPRYRSHGAKSDASDAYLLADLLRTDGHRWRELSPQSDSIRALRALVRSRDDLVATRVALGNQLRSHTRGLLARCGQHLRRHRPRPSAWRSCSAIPTPASAARLSEAALRRFWRSQHYSGRRSPAELLARLTVPQRGLAGPLTTDGHGRSRAAHWWRCCSHWSSRSPNSPGASSASSSRCPTGRSSCPSRAPGASAPRRSWPSWATCASAFPPSSTSPPRPVPSR